MRDQQPDAFIRSYCCLNLGMVSGKWEGIIFQGGGSE
jgi:hypothetical protein